MSTEDDIAKLAELGKGLATPGLDAPIAERIARRARDDIGHGPDLRRLAESAIAVAIVIPYAVWVLLAVLAVLR